MCYSIGTTENLPRFVGIQGIRWRGEHFCCLRPSARHFVPIPPDAADAGIPASWTGYLGFIFVPSPGTKEHRSRALKCAAACCRLSSRDRLVRLSTKLLCT